MEGVAGMEGVDEDSSGSMGGGRVCSGWAFVGLVLMYLLMRSGVLAGVTLSMNCHEGSSRTVELVSEWSGTGMSEADSMSFCSSC